jgi:hypothetical protein
MRKPKAKNTQQETSLSAHVRHLKHPEAGGFAILFGHLRRDCGASSPVAEPMADVDSVKTDEFDLNVHSCNDAVGGISIHHRL